MEEAAFSSLEIFRGWDLTSALWKWWSFDFARWLDSYSKPI